jgi:PIN domain nuclease of toxin-antitoxin system
MKALLDTQLYLWFVADSSKLKRAARASIDAADEIYVSAASIWEASIKGALGKLDALPEDLVAAIAKSGFVELPVRAVHAAAVSRLPNHHRDPFDRLLVAQAMHEPLTLLTTDPVLKQYSPLVTIV